MTAEKDQKPLPPVIGRAPRHRKVATGITDGGLTSSLWRLALPMMVGGFLQDLFSLADLFFVSRLGHVAVAALTTCGAMLSIMMMLTMGIGTGTTALVAHFVGNKEYDRADNALVQTILLGLLAALPITLLGIFGAQWLIKPFGVSDEVAAAALGYLQVNLIASALMFLSVGLNQAFNGAGDPMTPLRMLVVANAINIVLDPLLIFGVGPFPKLGIVGSAVATVFSRGVVTALLFRHVLFGHSALHLRREACTVNPPVIGRIISIGAFASLQVFLRQISFVLLIRLVASFGDAVLAGYGIANRLRFAVMVPGMGLANAGAVMVGQNMGAGKPDRARSSGWATVRHFEMLAVPMAVVYIALAPLLLRIFSDNAEVVRTGSVYLRFLAATFPFLAVSLVLGRAVSGAGDTVAPAALTGLGQLLLRVPTAYFMALAVGLGPLGIWLAVNASDLCQAGMFALYFRSSLWQKRYYRHRGALERGTQGTPLPPGRSRKEAQEPHDPG
jgi:putative MATE family efflux protein